MPSACSGGAAKKQHVVDVVKFYLEARALAKRGDLFDGANHKVRPHALVAEGRIH